MVLIIFLFFPVYQDIRQFLPWDWGPGNRWAEFWYKFESLRWGQWL